MNKLLFNEGGQPVFLDDLQTLQETSQNQLALLLDTLGARNEAFLLNELTAEFVSYDEATGKITTKIAKGWIVKGGVIYEIPQTTISISSLDSPLYVGFRTTESDSRTFNDGQNHNCVATLEAYLSATKLNDTMLNVFDLKTIWQLMAPLIKANTQVEGYKNIKVQFINGYYGTVQYKDVGDAYRIKIDVRSKNHSWENIGVGLYFGLFYFDDETVPFIDYSFFADVVQGIGGDTEARALQMTLHNRERTVELEGVPDDSSVFSPAECAVKAIFEFPK